MSMLTLFLVRVQYSYNHSMRHCFTEFEILLGFRIVSQSGNHLTISAQHSVLSMNREVFIRHGIKLKCFSLAIPVHHRPSVRPLCTNQTPRNPKRPPKYQPQPYQQPSALDPACHLILRRSIRWQLSASKPRRSSLTVMFQLFPVAMTEALTSNAMLHALPAHHVSPFLANSSLTYNTRPFPSLCF